jgi:membrane protease YdiL (CAAX protease family)
MKDTFAVVGLLVGFVLGIRGMYLFYVNRYEVRAIFGVETSPVSWRVSLVFFALIFFLFLGLTFLNVLIDLVEVDSINKVEVLGRSFLSVMSIAILEEFVFRLLLFYSLVEFIKSRAIIVIIVSVLFSIFHMPETPILFFSYFLGGVMYGCSYIKFQNILVPIAIHFSWNYVQGAIFGYPVTGSISDGLLSISIIPDIAFNGGDQGPEGSYAGIVMRLLIILGVYLVTYNPANVKFLTLNNL